ncbi:MAG TPA: hypothetical protein PLU22_00405 [Polyangiaceae bacterium]|nr:hypothetical protein [Polyangiaceae bacterium]
MQDPADECGDGYESVWSVDRGARTLTWDYCGWSSPALIERGSRTLSDAELQGVVNTLSIVAPSPLNECGADKERITLELEVDGPSTSCLDDFYSCLDEPNARFVQRLDPLVNWVRWCSSDRALPATPAALFGSTGDTLEPDPPSGSTCWEYYAPLYELDVATRKLDWGYCTTTAESGAYTAVVGSRVLDEAELEAVLDAYADLALGASGPCDSLSVPTSSYVASVRIDDDLYLIDEGASCSAAGFDAFAIGVRALSGVIEGLVR